jgi:hypothetical protein
VPVSYVDGSAASILYGALPDGFVHLEDLRVAQGLPKLSIGEVVEFALAQLLNDPVLSDLHPEEALHHDYSLQERELLLASGHGLSLSH